MEGLNCVVRDTKHRKEVVAGGLGEYLTEGVQDTFIRRTITNLYAEYCSLADRLGGHANEFWPSYIASLKYPDFEPIQLIRVPLEELPQVCPLTFKYFAFSNLMSF